MKWVGTNGSPGLETSGIPLCALNTLHSAPRAAAEDCLLCTVNVWGKARTEVQLKIFCVIPNSLRWCREVCLRILIEPPGSVPSFS